MVNNEQTIAVNTEVEFEVQRMTDYAGALQDNLESMAKDYQDQEERSLEMENLPIPYCLKQTHQSLLIPGQETEKMLNVLKCERSIFTCH